MATSSPKKRALILAAIVMAIPLLIVVGFISRVAVNVLFNPDRARAQSTTASLATVRLALQDYQLKNGTPAPSLAALSAGQWLPPGPVVDGWGHPITYSPSKAAPHGFVLTSDGADGVPGTSDDITVAIP